MTRSTHQIAAVQSGFRGELNKALENHLRPQILELTSQSRDPITVFIHSDARSGDGRIMSLLRWPDADNGMQNHHRRGLKGTKRGARLSFLTATLRSRVQASITERELRCHNRRQPNGHPLVTDSLRAANREIC